MFRAAGRTAFRGWSVEWDLHESGRYWIANRPRIAGEPSATLYISSRCSARTVEWPTCCQLTEMCDDTAGKVSQVSVFCCTETHFSKKFLEKTLKPETPEK